jgi:hypothetical protein
MYMLYPFLSSGVPVELTAVMLTVDVPPEELLVEGGLELAAVMVVDADVAMVVSDPGTEAVGAAGIRAARIRTTKTGNPPRAIANPRLPIKLRKMAVAENLIGLWES